MNPNTIIHVPAPSRNNPKAWQQHPLTRKLRRLVGKAIADFSMIEANDRVMVCLSGGKDSHALLLLLLQIQHIAPIEFDLVAVNLDQGHPGFPQQVLPEYLEQLGVEFHIEHQDTYTRVKELTPPGQALCARCSRFRRAILYRLADQLGASKVALGHHMDDIVHTFFLNLFYGGKLKAMPPKLRSDDGRHILIRPLAYCREADLSRLATMSQVPIIPCDLCGSQDQLKRQQIKRMVNAWERSGEVAVTSLFRSLTRVVPSHLADGQLFDFSALSLNPSEAEED